MFDQSVNIYNDPSSCIERMVQNLYYKYGNTFMLRVRDSNKDQTVFDRVQPGEHSIELKVTETSNAWNLAANQCICIELARVSLFSMFLGCL